MTWFIVLYLFLALCPLNHQSHAATKLVIGQSTINPRSTPLWIAQEKGIFQKYGIDATFVYVRNTPMMITTMKSGGIPVAAHRAVIDSPGVSHRRARPDLARRSG